MKIMRRLSNDWKVNYLNLKSKWRPASNGSLGWRKSMSTSQYLMGYLRSNCRIRRHNMKSSIKDSLKLSVIMTKRRQNCSLCIKMQVRQLFSLRKTNIKQNFHNWKQPTVIWLIKSSFYKLKISDKKRSWLRRKKTFKWPQMNLNSSR